MSDNHIDIIQGSSNNEKNEINCAVSSGGMEDETNEYFEFKEETLQISDVHAFEHSHVGELSTHNPVELSSTSRILTTSDSPASINRFLPQTPDIEASLQGAADLQSELAALGLNSLYSLAGQSEDSIFGLSAEMSYSQTNNDSMSSKVMADANSLVTPVSESVEPNLMPMEVSLDENYKLIRNQSDDVTFDKDPLSIEGVSTGTNNTSIAEKTSVLLKNDEIDNTTPEDENHEFKDSSIHFSQLTSNNGVLEDVEKVCLSSISCNSDDLNRSGIESKSDVTNISNKEHSVIITGISDHVQSNSDCSNLPSIESDDEFVEAVDSFVTPGTSDHVQNNSDCNNLQSKEPDNEFVEAVDSFITPGTSDHVQNNSDCNNLQSKEPDNEFVEAVDSFPVDQNTSFSEEPNLMTSPVSFSGDLQNCAINKSLNLSTNKSREEQFSKSIQQENESICYQNDESGKPEDSSKSDEIGNDGNTLSINSENKIECKSINISQEIVTSSEGDSNAALQVSDNFTEELGDIKCEEQGGNISNGTDKILDSSDTSDTTGTFRSVKIPLIVELTPQINTELSLNNITPCDVLDVEMSTSDQEKLFQLDEDIKETLETNTYRGTVDKTHDESTGLSEQIEESYKNYLLESEECIKETGELKSVTPEYFDSTDVADVVHRPSKSEEVDNTLELSLTSGTAEELQQIEILRLEEIGERTHEQQFFCTQGFVDISTHQLSDLSETEKEAFKMCKPEDVTNFNDVKSPTSKTFFVENEISESFASNDIIPLRSDQVSEETHQVQLYDFGDVGETNQTEMCIPKIVIFSPEPTTTERSIEENILELNKSMESDGMKSKEDHTTFEGVVEESLKIELMKFEEIDECELESSIYEDVEKISLLKQIEPEELVEETHNIVKAELFTTVSEVELSEPANGVMETKESQSCMSEEVVEEKLQLEVREDLDIPLIDQSKLKRDVENSCQTELSRLETETLEGDISVPEEVITGTQHVCTPKSVYIRNNEFQLNSMYGFEDDSEQTLQAKTPKSEEAFTGTQTEETLRFGNMEANCETSISNELDFEASKMESSNLENVLGETSEIYIPKQFFEETYEADLSRIKTGIDEITIKEKSIQETIPVINKSSSEEAVQEVQRNISTSEDNLNGILCDLDSFTVKNVEGRLKIKPSRNNNSLNEMTPQLINLKPDDFEEELCLADYTAEKSIGNPHQSTLPEANIITEETQEIKQQSNSKNPVEEIVVGFEEFDDTHKVTILAPGEFAKKEREVDESKTEEYLRETPNKVKCSNEEVSECNMSVIVEEEKMQSDFSQNSFHSQQAQDMSLTIVGPSTNSGTSEFSGGSKEEKCQSPPNEFSRSLTEFLDNINVGETNEFTSHDDQKIYDAQYLPLPESNENNYSVIDNGLQSFMEITMANTNVAMIEQNVKNSKLSFDQNLHQERECSEESKKYESSPFNLEQEERFTSFDSTLSESHIEHTNNKNHEMMQQSMCDYVTNQSLKLSIPESDDFCDVDHADEDNRKRCEEQTENVLLMKWPAQYHNDLKMLRQHNQFLSDSSIEKDAYINKLKQENENLLQTLSELTIRSEEIDKENCTLKNTVNKSKDDNKLIVELKEENSKLSNDLEGLKSIEESFSVLKIRNEELLLTIENNRLEKEEEINILKVRLKESEDELVKMSQSVIDFQSQTEEIAKLVESIHGKESQIENLVADNTMLEGKVAYLDDHLKILSELKLENDTLKDFLEIEKEKSKNIDELNEMLEKQNHDICGLNDKLSQLVTDLKEKEQQIEDLFEDKINLNGAVTSLNEQLQELKKIEDENRQLKSDLQEEKSKSEEKADLIKLIETLNQQMEELKGFEVENEHLKMAIQHENEEIKKIKHFNSSLEEQVDNLKAQNELLWNELKVSSTKEQNLYALKEERFLLEEKLIQMKKEIQEISILKSDNEHLLHEITKKDDEIRNLIADKRKLKSSLIKANDKLNERDAEIERMNETFQFLDERLNMLTEEKAVLQNHLDEVTGKHEDLKNEMNEERLILAGTITNVSECISSVIFENAYHAEEINEFETKEKKFEEEILSLKKKVLEEQALLNVLQSEKENLVNSVDNLKESLSLVTDKLTQYKHQANEISTLKEENTAFISRINDLNLAITAYEDEKTCILGDMSSLSETISNLLLDKQLLSEQVQVDLEMSANKDMIINELEESIRGLEDHLSSMNEELMSEMSKNQFLSVTINELEHNLGQSNDKLMDLQSRMSSLEDQLREYRDKSCDVNCLEQLVANLECHISSLNEELMSEFAKNDFLSAENENLESKYNEITQEKIMLENMLSCAEGTLKNRLHNMSDDSSKQQSLQMYINEIIKHINNFENDNIKLNSEINNIQIALQSSQQDLSDLMKAKQSLELELSSTTEQRLELENKLTIVASKESHIQTLEKENESLKQVSELHKCCDDSKRLLQSEKLDLEVQIQSLTESIESLHNEQHQLNKHLQESLQLKEVMTKEIHSLTGEVCDSNVESLMNIYQILMKEFLNKEKEVIFSLQHDCESKIKTTQNEIISLKNELEENEILTTKLKNEVEECKEQLKHSDSLISGLENELIVTKNELNRHVSEIEEIKLNAGIEKERLMSELNIVHDSITKAEEKISILSNEVNCKNCEIVQLKNDLEISNCEKTNLLRRTEEDSGVSKHKEDLIDELTFKLNDKEEMISHLNLQLQNKNNEVSQLTEYLEKKEEEARQYLTKIEETNPALLKLSTIEDEVDLINNILTSLDEGFDKESFLDSLHSCQVLGDMMKLVASKYIKLLNDIHISEDNLKLDLVNQVEVCKSLETQISDMNEELKSHKLLYDEDSLQFKEEIAAKNATIASLTEALEKLKSIACSKTETSEIENIKEELYKLKEENKKLNNESTKMSYLTEVNRKLSWEIEELSRSIKFEKQSNIELKTKCDIATNQVADLSKKNFQLEDKIDVLEGKLKNHDIMSSLKIGFPVGVNTVDKQVQYLNEKLTEFNVVNTKLSELINEHSSLKLEFEKSKEYIKKQEEKLCKIMKRELELKKQIASSMQTPPDIKVLKHLKTELLSLFPSQNLSLAEVLPKIKSLVDEGKKVCGVNNTEIDELKQKVEELSQENKDLDVECDMMNKHIKEQEELLASIFKREEDLKKLNAELKSQLQNQTNSHFPATEEDFQELFRLFPEKPNSVKDSISLVKLMLSENISLKEKVSESQEEYASLDKECEDMFKAYQTKEKDLADVLKREAVLKDKKQALEDEVKSLSMELEAMKSQPTARENPMGASVPCQCDELKSRLSELKVDLAERSAKVTALELQFEADNFPLKKKVADLEKQLDQAKQKINELKSEVRRHQEQMYDVTVGLRADCERCRSLGTPADSVPASALNTVQQQLQEKNKEINILKALCKTRNQRIRELEERDGSYKMSRSQRSALKEGKENKTVPPSPTKPSKGGLQ